MKKCPLTLLIILRASFLISEILPHDQSQITSQESHTPEAHNSSSLYVDNSSLHNNSNMPETTATIDIPIKPTTEPPETSEGLALDQALYPAIIPTPYPISRYEPLWKRSPFVLSTAAAASPIQLAQQYTLGGFAIINNEPYITVVETATQRRYLVSKSPSKEHRLVLISISDNPDKPLESSATISINGAPQTITFDKNAIAIAGSGFNPSMIQSINPLNPQGINQQIPQPFPNRQQFNQNAPFNPQDPTQQFMPQNQPFNPMQPQALPGTPTSGATVTPPDIIPASGGRIIRRRIIEESANTGQPMAIPPNTIPNQPTQ